MFPILYLKNTIKNIKERKENRRQCIIAKQMLAVASNPYALFNFKEKEIEEDTLLYCYNKYHGQYMVFYILPRGIRLFCGVSKKYPRNNGNIKHFPLSFNNLLNRILCDNPWAIHIIEKKSKDIQMTVAKAMATKWPDHNLPLSVTCPVAIKKYHHLKNMKMACE